LSILSHRAADFQRTGQNSACFSALSDYNEKTAVNLAVFNKENRHFSVFCRKPVNPVVFSCFNANKCRFFPEKKAKKERNPACFIKITIDFAPFLEYHYNRYGLFDTKRLKALIFRVGRPGTSAAQGRSNRFL